MTVRFWLQADCRVPWVEEVRGYPRLVPVSPSSSATAGTDPLHPNTVASQRVPSLTGPAGEGEGGSAGAGGCRGGTWGNVRREKRGDMGGGRRMHKRRHRRGQRSRYSRVHVEGDFAGDRDGNGSWREAHRAGGYLGGTVAGGDPHWCRDTPAGTVAHGRPRLEQETSEKSCGSRVRNQEQQQETIKY